MANLAKKMLTPPRRYRKRNTAQNLKAMIKAELKKNIETKYSNQNHSLVSVDNTGVIYDLTPIPQGTQDIQRIGDEITVKSLQVRLNAIAGDVTNFLRMVIFQWIPNDANPPTVANILNGQGGTVALVSAYYQNDTLGNNYIVLYDKVFTMSQTGNTAAISRNLYCPMKYAKKRVQFNAATTEGQNKFYVILVSDSAAASHVGIDLVTRMTFSDA